ncbi:MAG: CPBP family intramembrane metalloprotease [Ferruginibacter sp.]|nr:CPBP family intramembrane metalloprotease [Ferruginibacter sp.]
MLDGLRWNVISVVIEELIFRCVPLYILIKKLGPSKAIIVSACAFGIYHWFSFGVIGNIPQMVIMFVITGLIGSVLTDGAQTYLEKKVKVIKKAKLKSNAHFYNRRFF